MKASTKHLALMVREARLGAVKRRLAAEIGALGALRFYRAASQSLVRRLSAAPGWQCWIALTPDRAARSRGAYPASARVIPQGPGDLGARMGRIARGLPPGPVVFLGSDAPQVGAAHVRRAFAALGRAQVVLGPAADGGYWLIGFSRRPLPMAPFAGVRWSSPSTLADTLAALPGRFHVAYLETLRDVDSAADLAALGGVSSARGHAR